MRGRYSQKSSYREVYRAAVEFSPNLQPEPSQPRTLVFMNHSRQFQQANGECSTVNAGVALSGVILSHLHTVPFSPPLIKM